MPQPNYRGQSYGVSDFDFSPLTGAAYGGYGSPQMGYEPLPLPSALTGFDVLGGTGASAGMAGFSPAAIGGYTSALGPNGYNLGVGPAAGGAAVGGSMLDTSKIPTGPQKQGVGTLGYVQAGIDGLQTLGNLWMGFKQMKLAKKSFKFSKDMAETNLANTIKAYNTNLSDRARSRGFTEGQSQAEIDRYVAANSATRRG